MLRSLSTACALALVASVLPAQSAPTIAQFMSPASPLTLVSARKADRLAWMVYDRGMRNVYTAAAPDFKPVRLTSFLEDDGTDLTDVDDFRRRLGGGLRPRLGAQPVRLGGQSVAESRTGRSAPSGRCAPREARRGASPRERHRSSRPMAGMCSTCAMARSTERVCCGVGRWQRWTRGRSHSSVPGGGTDPQDGRPTGGRSPS